MLALTYNDHNVISYELSVVSLGLTLVADTAGEVSGLFPDNDGECTGGEQLFS